MKKLRVGVIGTGSLAVMHIKAYKENPYVELSAICDINRERAEQTAASLGIDKVFYDYNELLKCDFIDAVDVITWNNTHAPISIAALNAGKHVLCEKPPALNASEALEMQEASLRNNKLLMFGFVRRFSQYTQAIKEYLDNEIGEIFYAKTAYLRRCGNPGGWFTQKSLSGGGPLIDLGVHIIDLAIYMMGKPKPVSVFGATYNKLGMRNNIKGTTAYKSVNANALASNVEDFAHAVIKFDNGATLQMETSWTMHIKEDTQYLELYGDKCGARLMPEFEIFGEKNDYLVNLKPVLDKNAFNPNPFISEINHFADCILNGAKCIAPAEDGVAIMKILDAIYRSSETGELAHID